MKTHPLVILTIPTFILTLFLGCLLGYWQLEPDPIVYKTPNSVPVDKAVYHPGDRISYTIEYCKKKNIQGIVSRTLVNDIRIDYTEYTTNVLPGCGIKQLKDIIIPTYIDPGIYHIETTATYKLNPIRTAVETWRSVDFKIVN